MKPTPEFWRLLGMALVFFAVLGGIALVTAAGGFQ